MMSGPKRVEFVALAIIAVIVGLIGSTVWSVRVNSAQQEERDDLNLFLDASSAGWAEVTEQFFAVPETTAQTIGALLPQMQTPAEQIALLAESIRSEPSLDAAFVGSIDGSFLFVGRSDEIEVDGFRIRRIFFDADDERVVELTWTDAQLRTARTEFDPSDSYDPRARPWFQPVADGAARTWTEPYLFASSQEPGITHGSRVDAGGDLLAVVGIDIRLTQLSDFLDELRPGVNGEALVVDAVGGVIAASPMNVASEALARAGSGPLEQSPDLQTLVDELAIAGPDAVALTQDAGRTTVARPAGIANGWYLAVRAADNDFLGAVATKPARNALGIVAVGIASASVVALAGLALLRYLARLRSDAEVDELTGLLNRRAVRRGLGALLDSDVAVEVAILDLDRFKDINDRYGHHVGDGVLTAIASRISAFAHSVGGEAGRLGGDEFVVYGDSVSDWMQLNAVLRQPIVLEADRFVVEASIGVVTVEPDSNRSLEDVLRAADHALFEVKREGGAAFRVNRASAPTDA